jgi:ABC-type thiamine transport system ATPase subunit
MSHVSINELTGTSVRSINAELEFGLHVVLSLDQVGVQELIPLLDGSTQARQGSVRIDDRSPYRCPELRRRIGSLWATEYLPKASTLEQSLAALRLPESVLQGIKETLDAIGDNPDLTRPMAMLDQTATQHVALALALSKPDPLALLLCEPFVGASRNARAAIAERLSKFASSIPVVIVTSSQTTAQWLGGACAELSGGFWRRLVRQPSELVTLRVSGQSLRSLAAEIVRRPRVRSLRMTSPKQGHDELWLETDDPSSVSLDIVRSAQQLGCRIWALETRAGVG